jgi:hypothetical protein
MTPQEDSKPGRTRREGNITYIQTEFATRVRMAVISLAKREAREAVKRNLRAEGKVKVWLHSASEINTLANAHGPCSGAFRPSRSFVDCVVLGGRRECPQRSQKPNTRSSGPTRSKGNSAMSELTPMAVNRTLPFRRPNREYRQREYLTAGARSGMLRRSFWRIGMACGRRS